MKPLALGLAAAVAVFALTSDAPGPPPRPAAGYDEARVAEAVAAARRRRLPRSARSADRQLRAMGKAVLPGACWPSASPNRSLEVCQPHPTTR